MAEVQFFLKRKKRKEKIKKRMDFVPHQYCSVDGTVYVKEDKDIFRLEYESAFNLYRGQRLSDAERDAFGKNFSVSLPSLLVGYQDISVSSEPIYLGFSTKGIQTGDCKTTVEKKRKLLDGKKKAPVVAAAAPSSSKVISIVSDDDSADEDVVIDQEESSESETGDEDYDCETEDGEGSPKKRAKPDISPPELKRSKTMSMIRLEDEDTIQFLDPAPKPMVRSTDPSYGYAADPLLPTPLLSPLTQFSSYENPPNPGN